MTWSLGLGCVWVLLSSVTAMLPMRHQYAPAVTLLIAAPVLLIWLGIDYGWWVSVLCGLAFVSMFRYPLRFLWRKATGQNPQLPR